MNAPLYPRTNYPEADERASAGRADVARDGEAT